MTTLGAKLSNVDLDAAYAAALHGAAGHTDITRSIYFNFFDVRTDGASGVFIGTAPDATSVYSCANAATQGAGTSVAMPVDYSAGTNITITVLFSPDASAAANVRMRLNWAVAELGDDPTEAGTAILQTEAVAADTLLDSFAFAAFTPTGLAAGDMLRLFIHRLESDAADTYTGAFRIVGFKLDYTAIQ